MQIFLTNQMAPFALLCCILISQAASLTIAFMLILAFIEHWPDLDSLALFSVDYLITPTASTV